MIFDSHAHYDDPKFDEDRETLLPCLNRNGIDYITNVGCDIETSIASVELSKKYPFIYAAVGFHPECSDKFDANALSEIEKLLLLPKVVALGEIGLDYHYPLPSHEEQQSAFLQQLSLADDLKIPVIIHSRDASNETLQIIKKYKPKGVVHCFSGSPEIALEYVKLGMYIGITGVITFQNARKTVEVVERIPEDRLLIETDCPYLAPVPMRGKRCDSSMLLYTGKAIADIKKTTEDAIFSRTKENAKNLYGIK